MLHRPSSLLFPLRAGSSPRTLKRQVCTLMVRVEPEFLRPPRGGEAFVSDIELELPFMITLPDDSSKHTKLLIDLGS